uniref:Fibronectin type-III domain-containing protein n=1 Tax=Timema shepardi TaxID=629360 RepID=A0A7R9G4P7_TIMSH|nr:unnamed protein product [Timema shepardi]
MEIPSIPTLSDPHRNCGKPSCLPDRLPWLSSRSRSKMMSPFHPQIQTSAQKTISEIDSTFDLLVSTLLESLNKRRALLRTEALRLRDDGLAPLKACRDIIDEKLRATKLYIEEGRSILRVGGLTTSLEKTLCFTEQASLLGSLPAVPNLEEVADLSFQCPVESIVPELQQCVANIGQVSRMGPVQITEVHEKPGALLVQWEEVRTLVDPLGAWIDLGKPGAPVVQWGDVDYERAVDVHSFRLQLAYGDVRGQDHLQLSNYHDAYIGPEGQHLVRDLRPGVPYTFRVCCRVEGSSDWSAWSLPRVALTRQQPFCWGESNSNYLITNEKKLASKMSPEQSVLLSSTAQFGPGHSIEFTSPVVDLVPMLSLLRQSPVVDLVPKLSLLRQSPLVDLVPKLVLVMTVSCSRSSSQVVLVTTVTSSRYSSQVVLVTTVSSSRSRAEILSMIRGTLSSRRCWSAVSAAATKVWDSSLALWRARISSSRAVCSSTLKVYLFPRSRLKRAAFIPWIGVYL